MSSNPSSLDHNLNFSCLYVKSIIRKEKREIERERERERGRETNESELGGSHWVADTLVVCYLVESLFSSKPDFGRT
jgi:hypothetical protein